MLVTLGVTLHTRFTADLSTFLPAAPDAEQRVLTEQLQGGLPTRTLLVGIEGGDASQRAAASRALAAGLRASGQFAQVQNGELSSLAAVGSWVFEHRYLLSPAVRPDHFSATGLRDAIDESLSLLGTPAGATVKRLLDSDPTGETQRIAELSISGGGPRMEQGVWVSRDGTRALLMLVSRAEGSDLEAQAHVLALVRQLFAADATGLTLRLTGAPLFAVESRAQIESEVRTLAIAGSVLLGALLLVAFGSVRAVGAVTLPVASGVLAGIATVSLVFGHVHGITLGFGVTLIGEAVDYAIYYLIQARAAAPEGWRHWQRLGWPTVRLGLLTSLCGFAALALSGFPSLAQLGVFSMSGLVAAALTTRFVLPVLLPDGAPGRGLRGGLGRQAQRLARQLPRLRRTVTGLGVAALAWLVWQAGPLWQAELSSLSPISSDALALDTSLRGDLSASDAGALVIVQGADAETTLQRAEAAAGRLDALVADGRLLGYDSVTRLLPSLATQAQRRAALPTADALSRRLAAATAGGPLPAARLGAFLSDVQAARTQALITPASVQGSPAQALVDALLLPRPDGHWAALLPLHAHGDSVNTAAVAQALAGMPETRVIQIGEELRRLYRHYLQEAQAQTLVGGAAVLLLMAVWLRSGRRLLAVCLPLLMAVLLTFAGLQLLQVPLGILHLVGLLLVAAVGSNYALFFDMLHTGSAPDEDMMTSLVLANLTTVLSFGLIALSGIPALSAIGRVVAPGALLALLLSAVYAQRPVGAVGNSKVGVR